MQDPFPFPAPARLIDFMRQADQPGLINLAAGVPGLDALPFPALEQAMVKALATEGAAMFAYHHPEGDRPLRDLLAARLRERSVQEIQGEEIVTVTGCTQALQVMLSILIKPGEVVACEAPAYYGLLELLAEAGAHVLPLPVRGGGGIDLSEAEALFTRFRPKCAVVCTSLSNPSGATLSLPDRERLVAICRKTGVRLIEDDIYAELLDGGALPPCRAFDDGRTVSFVTSFSKSVAPGIRVGYAAPGTPELHDAFAARKTQQDLHSAVVTEVLLRSFIEEGSLDPHLDWLRERNRVRRGIGLAAARESFPVGSRIEAPAGGYMLWAELPPHFTATQLRLVRDAARKEGVVFAGGEVFYAKAPEIQAVRLNCAKADEASLDRGVRLLGDCLRAAV